MIAEALAELKEYLAVASGRIDPQAEAEARRVLDFASERITVGQQSVIALAGATGSGKSSLFNQLSGTDLATVGARRPTTARPLALSFSATNRQLLDLLHITQRHEALAPVSGFDDVVLLDLPDHDSIQPSHREEVDRMVHLVDQFIFVVDPQKYADDALHRRYLRPLAKHSEVITVVLNHADELLSGAPIFSADGDLDPRLDSVVEHLRWILAQDGLGQVKIFVTNALTGEGIEELREYLVEVARTKKAMMIRLAADLSNILGRLRQGKIDAKGIAESRVQALQQEVSSAAGVPRLAEQVRCHVVKYAGLCSGNPEEILALPSHQVATAADDDRVVNAVRSFVRDTTALLPELWREQVRRDILQGPAKRLSWRVHAATREIDLSDLAPALSWRTAKILKVAMIIAIVATLGRIFVGMCWGGLDGDGSLLCYLGISLAVVTVLTLLIDWWVRSRGRRAARQTMKRLNKAVEEVVQSDIVNIVESELDAYQRSESVLERMAGILARGY